MKGSSVKMNRYFSSTIGVSQFFGALRVEFLIKKVCVIFLNFVLLLMFPCVCFVNLILC